MRALLIASLVLLAACESSWVSERDLEDGRKVCEPNGGIASIRSDIRVYKGGRKSYVVETRCKNDAYFSRRYE